METGNYIQPVYRDGKIIDIPEEDVSEIDWQETCRLLANSCAYVLSDANICNCQQDIPNTNESGKKRKRN
ncbi:uncharacterized protein DFL_003091 [Arthrobotrys flagrans]|uniref:Uncharacterized protein n=1 Tax=Arthrobotrys flagrans TaxID=97331 RepID=A0A437ADQ4_ARTFL|nr:hypothetical protein DFL_003091 [Arthrobotrys flagrans]